MKQIGVIGSGDATSELKDIAYEVGYNIGDDAVLICGGLEGVMKEACRGCKEAEGHTIGIIPGNDKRSANCYVDDVIVTGLGEARNVIVVKSSDVLIAVGGGFGTLSEISHAKKSNKKVIGVGDGFAKEFAEKNYIIRAKSPEDAVKKAIDFA